MGEAESAPQRLGGWVLSLIAILPILGALGGVFWQGGVMSSNLLQLTASIDALKREQVTLSAKVEGMSSSLSEVRAVAIANERELRSLKDDVKVLEIRLTRAEQAMIRKGLM